MSDSVYYDVLGTSRSSTDSEIKIAYRKSALKWHPDKHEGQAKELAEQKFREIAEAYTVLSDPRLRVRFDQYGLNGLKHGIDGTSSAWTFQTSPYDVFTRFFGDARPFTDLQGQPMFINGNTSKLPQMEPINLNVYLSLEELFTGAIKQVKVVRQVVCDDGKNTKVEEKVIPLSVKPGWKHDTKLTFPGSGDEGVGSAVGDLVLTIKEKSHPRFTRSKNDLVYTADISLLQGLCGCVVEVPMMDGRVLPVAVTEVVHPNYSMIIPAEGMPLTKDPKARGNLIIQFNVAYPSVLSIKQKEQLAFILPQ